MQGGAPGVLMKCDLADKSRRLGIGLTTAFHVLDLALREETLVHLKTT